MLRVADYIAKYIFDRGVKHVFMLSGGGIMYLTDALVCHGEIKAICLHHEQSVSMAVEAYAKAKGHFGVGYFTSGPGTTNALTGLVSAWLDSVSCLFISGQAKRSETTFKAGIPGLRQFGVQEFNILPLVKFVTKYAAFVDQPEDIRYHLEKALYLSKHGRPGPVWLDIPLDVQGAFIRPHSLRKFKVKKEVQKIDFPKIEKVAQYLKRALRPVILAGHGIRISGAIDTLSRFAQKYKIPIATTFLGMDIIGSDHPCHAGCVGIKGSIAGNRAVRNCDLLIVIGCNLNVAHIGYDYHKFTKASKIVVVDVDGASHRKKTIKIDLLIESDAKKFIEHLDRILKND